MMAGTVGCKLRVQEVFGMGILNPLQAFKMGVIVSMNASLDVLGPVGAYASLTFEGALPWLLAGAVTAWITLPLLVTTLIFAKRGST